MKPIILILCIFSLCSCANSNIIGGADSSTNITVGEKSPSFGEQLEKRPLRMFNENGSLFYDTSKESTLSAKCGTLDASLKKAVDENIIPQNSGQSNFDSPGYQYVDENIREVFADGKWIIFKKYENQPEELSAYKYCFYIKGHLNNADSDSELVVLTNNPDISFSKISEMTFGSHTYKTDSRYLISTNLFLFENE